MKKYSYTTSLIITLLVFFLYAVSYDYVYREYVCELFGYSGVDYYPLSSTGYFYMLIEMLFPVIFYRGLKSIASAFSIAVYILAYIPFIETLNVAGFPSEVRISYIVVFLVCMSSLFLTDHLKFGKKVFGDIKRKTWSIQTFEKIVICIFIITLLFNLNRLTFVNIIEDSDAMYEQRASNIAGYGPFSIIFAYLISWLEYVFLPILLIYYLNEGKWIRTMVLLASFVPLFMMSMQKTTLLMPPVTCGLFFLYKKFKDGFAKYFHILLAVAMGSVSLLCVFLSTFSDTFYMIASIIAMRTQCIEGMQLNRYMDFFVIRHHPFTHYSHIGFINSITHSYPYPESIGKMVAGNGGNSNATFWLMDGLAADGVIGCIFITLLFIIVKSFFNSISVKHNYVLVVLVLINTISAFLNVSLFTSLITCGMVVSYFVFYKLEDGIFIKK